MSSSMKDIWVFAKSRVMEVKQKLQNVLGVHFNIIAVTNAHNDLVEALYSKKELLRYLTMKDSIVIIGGLDNGHLDDNQFSINDFCNSLHNTNIILCDEKFNDNLISMTISNHKVKCIHHPKNLPIQDKIDHVTRLLIKEIQEPDSDLDMNNINHHITPAPSTSLITGDTGAPISTSVDKANKRVHNDSGSSGTSNPQTNLPNVFANPNLKPGPTPAKVKPRYTGTKLNIVHQNINGLIQKTGLLINKIRDMTSNNRKPDVICLTEHNLNDPDIDSVHIPGYELARTVFRDERRGGVCILLRDDLKFRVLPKVEENNDPHFLECCAVKLMDLDVIIVCMYRPPRQFRDKVEEFLDEFDVILRRYKKQKVVICGDFNIDTLSFDKSCKTFLQVVDDFQMHVAINTPTRMSTKTCVDNIIHNVQRVNSETLDWNLSDHNAQFLACIV